ncbi:hypothetical protein M3J09_005386 [Ascochyta lentis]
MIPGSPHCAILEGVARQRVVLYCAPSFTPAPYYRNKRTICPNTEERCSITVEVDVRHRAMLASRPAERLLIIGHDGN